MGLDVLLEDVISDFPRASSLIVGLESSRDHEGSVVSEKAYELMSGDFFQEFLSKRASP